MLRFLLDHAEVIAPEVAMIVLLAVLFAIPRTRSLSHRLIRTGRAMASDRTLPRWARYGFVVASLPIPGPFDEIAGGILAAVLLRGRHSATVRRHWIESAADR